MATVTVVVTQEDRKGSVDEMLEAAIGRLLRDGVRIIVDSEMEVTRCIQRSPRVIRDLELQHADYQYVLNASASFTFPLDIPDELLRQEVAG